MKIVKPNWRIDNIYLLLAITIGAVLRFYKLGAESFWVDEILSVTYARPGFSELVHPPLSYFILWLFIEGFGTQEFSARLPSCLFGIATIPLVYFFGKQLFGKNEGLVASFIISLSPWYIQWSQEARMYTQLTFFTVLALYFFNQAIYKENVTSYLLSCIFMTLAFYTHYSGFLIPLIIGFWLISNRFLNSKSRSINYKHITIFFGLFVILCIPSFFITIPQAIDYKFGKTFRWGVPSIGYFIFHLFSNKLGPILSLFSIFGALFTLLRKNIEGILLTVYVSIPFLTFSFFIQITNIGLRYLVFTLPGYALLSSYLLIEIAEKIKESEIDKEIHIKAIKNMQMNKILSIGVLMALLVGMVNLPGLYYHYSYEQHPDWRAACLFVKSNINPGDVVVSTQNITVEYYLGRCDYKLNNENFDEIKNSQSRVWLIIDDGRIDWIDPDYEIRNWLDSNCEKMKEVNLITVYSFTP